MADNKDLFELIDAFIDNEMALAAYYEACTEKLPENREKWQCLKREEEMHAQVFQKIRASAEELPAKWKIGRYTVQTVRLISNSVKSKTEELKQGTLNPRYAINFIVDVEQSLIESNIDKSLETDYEEFRMLLSKVQEDTKGHKKLLLSLIK